MNRSLRLRSAGSLAVRHVVGRGAAVHGRRSGVTRQRTRERRRSAAGPRLRSVLGPFGTKAVLLAALSRENIPFVDFAIVRSELSVLTRRSPFPLLLANCLPQQGRETCRGHLRGSRQARSWRGYLFVFDRLTRNKQALST